MDLRASALGVALLVACDPAPTTVEPGHTLFVGRVFDGTEAFDGAVEIDDEGVIVQVLRERPENVEGAVELGDGTLLPGLIDLHTHYTATGGAITTVPIADHEPNLKAMLRHGVTSALQLGGMARPSFEIRRRERDGEILSPRLFSVGPFLDPPGSSHCASGIQQLDHCVALPSPEAATTAVGNLMRLYEPDVLKITHDSGLPERPSTSFDAETLRALLTAAGDTPVVAHIRNVRDIDEAVAAGVPVITHLPFDERFEPEDAAPWVAAGTLFIPTIYIHSREVELATGQIDFDDAELAHDAPASAIEELRGWTYDAAAIARVEEVRENARHNLRSLITAGAILLAGSDAGVPSLFHGRSLIEEVITQTREGVPNDVALQGATSRAADLLRRPDLGRIAVGARADLVIVHGDPTTDIEALRRTRRVFLDGEELDRASLEVDRGVSLERDSARTVTGDAVCLRTAECPDGQTCTRLYRCADSCESATDCPSGSFCASDIGDGRGCYPDLGCDVFAQNCANGTACVPIANGARWCTSAGDRQPGESCDPRSIDGLCTRGTRCNAGTCEQLCDLGGGACPTGMSCVSLEAETGVAVGACR